MGQQRSKTPVFNTQDKSEKVLACQMGASMKRRTKMITEAVYRRRTGQRLQAKHRWLDPGETTCSLRGEGSE